MINLYNNGFHINIFFLKSKKNDFLYFIFKSINIFIKLKIKMMFMNELRCLQQE